MLKSTILKRVVGIAATVALSAGLGVATSGTASAASVWDRVAKCESGGNWKINTGNGFYGGLQFSASTWRAFGGGKYASTANKASKAEQIAIARRTLAAQGPGAWPVCSQKAGLTRSNGGASKNATPSGNSSSKKKTTKKKQSAPKAKSSKYPKKGQRSSKVLTLQKRLVKAGVLKSRYTTGYFGSLTQAAVKRYQGKVGLKRTGKVNKATWKKLAKNTGKVSKSKPKKHKASKAKKKTQKVSGKTVRVKRGDTIAKIANRHNVKGGWKGLYKLNKKTVKNPNQIYIGQVLRIR